MNRICSCSLAGTSACLTCRYRARNDTDISYVGHLKNELSIEERNTISYVKAEIHELKRAIKVLNDKIDNLVGGGNNE